MVGLQQTSEAFPTDHATFASLENHIGRRRHILGETLMASFRVVVRQKLAQGVFHLPLIEEDQPARAFLLEGPDHPFRKGIHVGSSRPRFLHQDSRVLENLIVGRSELLVAVADNTCRAFERPGHQLLRCRHQADLRGVLRHAGDHHLSGPDVDEEQDGKQDRLEQADGNIEKVALPEFGLSLQKLLPRPSSRARFNAVFLQNLPHPAGTNVNSREPQLCRDALTTPVRILPCQLQHQRLLLRRRFFPGSAPAPRRLLAFLRLVPPPQRFRPDDVHPLLPRLRTHRRRRVGQGPPLLHREAQLLNAGRRQMPKRSTPKRSTPTCSKYLI